MQNKKAENHHSNVTVLSFLFIANRFVFINTSCGDFYFFRRQGTIFFYSAVTLEMKLEVESVPT